MILWVPVNEALFTFLWLLPVCIVLVGGAHLIWRYLYLYCVYARGAFEVSAGLASDGIHLRTPQVVRVIPWREIAVIRDDNGDLYFWTRGIMVKRLSGMFIPRSAWVSDADRRQFVAAAFALWKSAGLAAWESAVWKSAPFDVAPSSPLYPASEPTD